jgi:uncharacterized membrane protein
MALGINNKGQVVGDYNTAHTDDGFLYSRGKYTILDVPGSVETSAIGINDKGEIVGGYGTGTLHAVFVAVETALIMLLSFRGPISRTAFLGLSVMKRSLTSLVFSTTAGTNLGGIRLI